MNNQDNILFTNGPLYINHKKISQLNNTERNAKVLSLLNEKIYLSQHQNNFSNKGSCAWNYIPTLFSRGYFHSNDDLYMTGSCSLKITCLLSEKVKNFSLSLCCLYPNTQYVHGVIRESSRIFEGITLLIDNCLFSKSEIQNSKQNIPNKLLSFIEELDPHPFESEISQPLKMYNNLFSLFKVEEDWLLPINGTEIHLNCSKFVVVQALYQLNLKSTCFPENYPMLANSGFSTDLMDPYRYLHGYFEGTKIFNHSKSDTLVSLNIKKDVSKIYYFITKRHMIYSKNASVTYLTNNSRCTDLNYCPTHQISFPLFTDDMKGG